MPNWCSNYLVVSGESSELERFLDSTGDKDKLDSPFHLMKLYPTPTELKETTSGFFVDEEKQKSLEAQQEKNKQKYGSKDWYDWNIKNWGTKWEVEMLCSSQTDEQLVFTFDSAWSPPCELLDKVAKMFPKLRFVLSYEELGNGFIGANSWHNGEELFDKFVNIDDDPRLKKAQETIDMEDNWQQYYDLVNDIRDEIEKQAEQACEEQV